MNLFYILYIAKSLSVRAWINVVYFMNYFHRILRNNMLMNSIELYFVTICDIYIGSFTILYINKFIIK